MTKIEKLIMLAWVLLTAFLAASLSAWALALGWLS